MAKAPQSELYEPPRLVTLGSVDDLTLQVEKFVGVSDGIEFAGQDLSGPLPPP